MDDRISATVRIPASQSDVTCKKGSKENEIRGQCYKTFYRGNLPPFHGHNIILCYKTLLLW